jgi:hypothetical protein
MKKLAHFTLAFIAAQLLFATIASASISTVLTTPKNPVCATPDEDGPFEIFATPDEDGPFEIFATPDEDGPFEIF